MEGTYGCGSVIAAMSYGGVILPTRDDFTRYRNTSIQPRMNDEQ